MHGSVVKALQAMCRECGCQTTLEEVVPELIQGEPGTDEAVEARLDLHVWSCTPFPAEWWVDATVSHRLSPKVPVIS